MHAWDKKMCRNFDYFQRPVTKLPSQALEISPPFIFFFPRPLHLKFAGKRSGQPQGRGTKKEGNRKREKFALAIERFTRAAKKQNKKRVKLTENKENVAINSAVPGSYYPCAAAALHGIPSPRIVLVVAVAIDVQRAW